MAESGGVRFTGLRRASAVTAMAMVCAFCFFFGVTWIRGGSMEPTLHPGDVVVYRRGGTFAGVDDVILFDKSGWRGGVVHRVVAVADDGALKTCGDANPNPDVDPVSRSDIRGVVVMTIPLGKAWRAVRNDLADVLHFSTNRTMRSDDGEASGTSVPPGTKPHGLEGLRGRAERFTPSAAT